MPHASRGVHVLPYAHSTGTLGLANLVEQKPMVSVFDTQNVVQVVIL